MRREKETVGWRGEGRGGKDKLAHIHHAHFLKSHRCLLEGSGQGSCAPNKRIAQVNNPQPYLYKKPFHACVCLVISL